MRQSVLSTLLASKSETTNFHYRKGFLDSGVERIVDQVVNPKLNTNFVPKIEDVSYTYLGIEKPINRVRALDINPMDQQAFLPNLDLEQVSPESEKSPSIGSLPEEKDDLESPAFEAIPTNAVEVKEEMEMFDDKMDISEDSNEELNKSNEANTIDDIKSNLSSISGLTSNESIGEICEEEDAKPAEAMEETENVETEQVELETGGTEVKQEIKTESEMDDKAAPVVQEVQQIDAAEQPDEKPSIHYSGEVENTNQDSVLSQVSSNSRLSIITNTRIDAADDGSVNNEGVGATEGKSAEQKDNTCPYGISEEAQMQQFNESSSSSNGLMIDTDRVSNGDAKTDQKANDQVVNAFDIKKEEIKFEGTERKSFDVELEENTLSESQQNMLEKLNIKDESVSPKETQSCETSKDTKNESLNSNNSEAPKAEIESPKPEEVLSSLKAETNSGTEDSKGIEDSNSSSSKSKDKSSTTSSSSQRSCADKGKDRHSSSSSKDRHKGDRDKDKRSHSSSHSSSRGVDGKHSSSSSKHRHESSNAKIHHKSSSSSSSTKKDSSRDKDKHRSHSESSSRKSSSNRQSSSSSHRDRKHDSKSSDRKSRSDSQRSTSTTSAKKDDHSSCKEKPSSRQRSRSKDSNDGSASGTPNNPESNAVTNSQTAANAQSGDNQTSEQQKISTNSSPISQSDSTEARDPSPAYSFTIPPAPIQDPEKDDDFVMTTQPIVVDQILAGGELNLEMFIDENRGESIVSSIEFTLADKAKIKKPKVAANIHEARKLMKIRKQIDREEQKKIEKAKVIAKQFIRSNASAAAADNCQGVELEFACVSSGAGPSIAGPSISSPVKFLPEGAEATVSPAKSDRGEEEFHGFNEQDVFLARQTSEALRNIVNKLKAATATKAKKVLPKKSGGDSNHSEAVPNDQMKEILSTNKLFLENNRINDSSAANKVVGGRKRKLTETSTTSEEAPSAAKILAESDEVANVVANVIISSQTSPTSRPESSTSRSGTC